MRSIFSVSHKALTALVTAVALLLMGGSAYAQTTSGKVIDTNGVPVIGAAVMVPGTTNGVTTDIDGNFTLRVAPGTRLEVSCIGYVTKT
ncbi:MAG: carboxypeptidase-like regulatory domain-containing protein, partial [Bacteroidales bacterium]|nr:carboxypeptidase-like regulatory domain-containing protein [Bacteroidales bacterium]